MKHFFTPLFFSFIAITAFSQSPSTKLYKISNDLAERLYMHEGENDFIIPDYFFEEVVDSFPEGGKSNLPLGHYLSVSAYNENTHVDLYTQHALIAKVFHDNKKLVVRLLDDKRMIILNAKISIDGKKLKYNEKTGTYAVKYKKQKGLLRIEADEELFFYTIDKNYKASRAKKRWRRFKRSKTGFYILAPIRWGRGTFRFFKNGIRGWGWHSYRWQRWQNRFNSGKKLKGYTLTNKPIYRHGDTLKVKAYLTKERGRISKHKKISFSFRQHRQGKVLYSQSFKPTPEGSYEAAFVLGDSLPLDKEYILDFQYKNYTAFTSTIKLEDYQLDEFNIDFNIIKEDYVKGEKIVLQIEGKDKNGFTIPDGQFKLVLTAESINNFYANEVFIPDTLWKHEEPLRSRGESQIMLPDSIFPLADMKVKAQITVTNAAGEMKQATENFNFKGAVYHLDMKLENGFLFAKQTKLGQPLADSATLVSYIEGNLKKESVQLPLKMPIDFLVTRFRLRTEHTVADLFASREGAGVVVTAKNKVDSLIVQIANPHKVPVYWKLQTTNRVLTEGQSKASFLKKAFKNTSQRQRFLRYQYIWGGKVVEDKITISNYTKTLNIEVAQQGMAAPGESIPVKVIVKNYKGQPVEKANLAAVGLNAKFGNKNSHKISPTSYKRSREPFLYNDFYELEENEKTFISPLTQRWYDTLSLKEQLFYRLRYETNINGFFMQYDSVKATNFYIRSLVHRNYRGYMQKNIEKTDSFYRSVAQFSPYLIENNKAQPVYMIYCNRKLVYYHGVDDKPQYAFAGKEGYNQIIIRGKNYEYTIDSVLLKKGMKLTFAIDANLVKKSPYKVRIKAVPNYLQYQEKKLLRRTILNLKHPRYQTVYIWDDSTNIHRILPVAQNKGLVIKAGPFHRRNSINYVQENDFKVTFRMEEGFTFSVKKYRDKLYENNWLNTNKKYYLPNKLPLQHPYQFIMPPVVTRVDKQETSIIAFAKSIRFHTKGYGQYIFDVSPSVGELKYVGLEYPVGEALVFKPSTRSFKSLSPGKYRLLIVKKNDDWFEKEFEIKANSTLYHNFENITLKKDSIDLQFETYFLQKNKIDDVGTTDDFQIIDYHFDGDEITGVITDASGQTLIGASVMIKGTTIGTVTDVNGRYIIKAPNTKYVLVISYTGFASQEIVSNTNVGIIDVTLEEGVQLQSVVIRGLGIAREEKTLGYAATIVQQDDVRQLMGKVPGVSIRGSRPDATAFYVDGIRVQGTSNTGNENKILPFDDFDYGEFSGIRSNFKDYAYWEPNLSTDKNGEAYFTAHLPDDITTWNTYVLGMDKRKRGGIGFAKTKAMKPLLAQLSLPRFLVEGDEVDVIGKTVNYTNDPFDVKTWFEWNGKIEEEKFATVKNVLIDKFKVKAPLVTDSLKLTYVLLNKKYKDGEERIIPVFKKGVMETVGEFYILESDTMIHVSPNPDFGATTIFATQSMLEVMLTDVDKLIKYPYGCNEQTASRLMALLLEKKIRKQLGEPFEHEAEIKKAIARLQKTQNEAGFWGWWQDGEINYWITNHVMKALLMAQKSDYKTQAFELGLRYFTNNLSSLKDRNLLLVIDMFSEVAQNMDYAQLLSRLDTKKMNALDSLFIIKIKQKNNLPYHLDALIPYEKKTIYGGIYFGKKSRYMLNNRIQKSLLAYQIYKNAGKTKKTKAIRQFFLHSRLKTGFGYRNTFQTASVLSTILPDILKTSVIDDVEGKLFVSDADGKNEKELSFGKNHIIDGNFKLTKKGDIPVFVTNYQTFLNPKPAKKDDWFVVKTELKQNGQTVTVLEKGSLVQLIVHLEIKEAADFVMIEIPIPASCSYNSKPNYNYRNREVHREYFKEKTAIFCQSLPQGKYTYVLDLQARYSGIFTVNPTKVEQMYFPVFYGRNEIKRIVVE